MHLRCTYFFYLSFIQTLPSHKSYNRIDIILNLRVLGNLSRSEIFMSLLIQMFFFFFNSF